MVFLYGYCGFQLIIYDNKSQSTFWPSAFHVGPRDVAKPYFRYQVGPRAAIFFLCTRGRCASQNSACAGDLGAWKQSPLDSAHAPNTSFRTHGQKSILWSSLNCARDGVERWKWRIPGPLDVKFLSDVKKKPQWHLHRTVLCDDNI